MGFFKNLFTPIRVNESQEAEIKRATQRQLLSDFFVVGQKAKKIAYLEYALYLAVDRITNGIIKSDFQTFKRGEKQEAENWWRMNYEPNQNENASIFWNKVIYQMVNNPDGALVVQSKSGEYLVADNYRIKRFAYLPNIYADVQFGDFQSNQVFNENEVFHFELGNSKVKSIISQLYEDYGQLIGTTIDTYNRQTAKKYILEIDSTFDQFETEPVLDENGNPVMDDFGEVQTKTFNKLDDLFTKRFKALFEPSSSVTPLEAGLKLEEIDKPKGSATTSKSGGTREITAIFDDVINMVADAFSIPRGFIKGDVADAGQMTDNFIAFAINPVVEQIEDEINRKLYGANNVKNHTYLKIRTENIRNYDVAKFATPAELLSRIGVMSVNEIRELLNREKINEDWADKHLISKNYLLVEDADQATEQPANLKGGEDNGEEEATTESSDDESSEDE